MDFTDLNLKYKAAFLSERTVRNLENYVLSEIYVPIADYQNAVNIIRREKISRTSIGLMFVEAYLCFTQLYCESEMLPLLKSSCGRFSPEENATLFYLEALSFFESKDASKSRIKECLDKSISYDVLFVSNFLYRAELEEDAERKSRLIKKACENVRRVYSAAECENSLDEKDFFDINNYIDAEIKCIDLTEAQAHILLPAFYPGTAK